ncbi:MICAL-like protein 1 [Pseudomyrmex gracilis]|uniref:MICAL-like protein 1 n=1 Tax=Pseudomyrmex gracilis TaxID=219809 RepID=UPI000995AE25|nr:MICAL-like protein 1 [Pseudomyrmex gracilis]XP_020282377.1 MICAL-like protein 1 [Pseudomyrmex gracilis]
MGERRGTKALELWCRRITDGYPGVNVQNMTTSWRDGLAFCAMIHHFRPDLIDFDSLNKNDVYGNNELAFRTAEQHLGIPALLDAEDMASCTVPDRLSILTYLSQFYQTFGGSSPNRLATNRTNSESADERIAPVPESPKQKVGSRLGMRRDPCVACGMPVFLAEKLLIARAPYHRTCFRCARCSNQLTPGNYYETEEGQYCCETCPDEEELADVRHKYTEPAAMSGAEREENELPRPLSDEEKERKGARNLLESTAVPDVISHTLQMRKNFMANHLLSEKVEESTVVKDDMSASTNDLEVNSDYLEEAKSRIGSAFPDDDENEEDEEEEEEEEDEEEEEEESRSSATDSPEVESNIEQQFDVHSALNSLNIKSDENQRSTAISLHDVDKRKEENTKELPENDERAANPEIKLSLVQKRLQMFESRNKIGHIDRKDQDKRRILIQDIAVDKIDSQDLASQDVLQANKKERSEKKLEEDSMMIKSTDNRENSIESVSKQSVENTLKITNIEKHEESIKDIEDNINTVQPEESSDITSSEREDFSKLEEKFRKDSENLHEEVATGNSVLTAKPIDLSEEGNKDYPEDLNPFKSDEEDSVMDNTPHNTITSSTISKVSTNPFDSEDEDIEESKPPKPATRSKSENRRVLAEMPVTNRILFGSQSNVDSSWSDKKDSSIRSNPHTVINSSKDSKVSTNPFDSEDEDIEEPEPPKPAARSKPENRGIATSGTKRVLAAPQINLDSFWSDEEEEHSDEAGEQNRTPQGSVPVPKPRTIKTTPETSTISRRADLSRGSVYASNSSLASFESTTTPGGTYRKKRPAPQPPAAKELFPSDQRESPNKSCNTSLTLDQTSSPRTTLRPRKSKPAPPPPVISSTPCNVSTDSTNFNFDVSPIIKLRGTKDDQNIWEDQKTNKDEANRNRQSLSGNSCDDSLKSYNDKSVQGKWKRKKGPAPPRPIPHRRKIKVLSMKDVKLELDEIELQQQGLERQGVRLEQMIRDKCESGSRIEDSLSTDVEELVLELFALVNEKNELFRRQAELILLRRQQRLEEEHAEVEYQIRCLMCQPEATKTDFDKQREEALIQRLVQIVERRNEIVECLEIDRRREVEEDKSINKYMGLFAARNKNKQSDKNNDSSSTEKTKKGKVKEKVKEKKSKKTTKKDADKDVDETEMKLKRHNKRKWF